MQDRVNTLDVGATVHLLASYGRLDDLMHYATFRQASALHLEYICLALDAAFRGGLQQLHKQVRPVLTRKRTLQLLRLFA